jgi:hypothetical protein
MVSARFSLLRTERSSDYLYHRKSNGFRELLLSCEPQEHTATPVLRNVTNQKIAGQYSSQDLPRGVRVRWREATKESKERSEAIGRSRQGTVRSDQGYAGVRFRWEVSASNDFIVVERIWIREGPPNC